ncbi:MAG TPA: PilX N-terminal domain-containing pilus assembly protein, partial [Steroidobacteraceae bacterium]
ISSLLLLMIVTIFAISMFRSFGMQERIAGNTRDKERARAAALTALQYAEWWIMQNNWSNAGNCTGLMNANANTGMVCLKTSGINVVMPSVTAVPWKSSSGVDVGTVYTPQSMNVINSAAADYYYAPPRYYISFISNFNHVVSCGNLYQIDAYGYGTNPNTVAVVESQFEVTWNNCGANGP